MNMKIVYGINEISEVVEKLHGLLDTCKVMTFTGPLGAGKTTLTRLLLQRCGVTDLITSPTFTYVNVYENKQGKTFYHFDCYRIKTVQEFQAAGFDEYLYQPNSIVFIEWPEVVMPLLTHDVCHVVIEYAEDKRSMSIECEVQK
jgi:tRNA threonylcarbamoyladenosine biosynthesis protein TsaE